MMVVMGMMVVKGGKFIGHGVRTPCHSAGGVRRVLSHGCGPRQDNVLSSRVATGLRDPGKVVFAARYSGHRAVTLSPFVWHPSSAES